MKKKVYLAGPISGLTWNETEVWRDIFKKRLEDFSPHIVGYSPLREKDKMMLNGPIADSYEGTLFSSQRAIMSRDFFDVKTSDAIVANLSGAKTVSIGTVMEIAWAYQLRIPVIIICNPENKIHNHAMVREAASWWVEDIDAALLVTHALFTP